jgi:hypothetical protein
VKGFCACMPWKERSHLIACVRCRCVMCNCEIALAANNVRAAKEFVLLCCPCTLELFPNEVGGGLVGGRVYTDMGAAVLAVRAEVQRN